MAELSGVEVLQSEIEKSRDKLKGYNDNIKKLTGRDVSRPGIRRLFSYGTERDDESDNVLGGRLGRGRGRLFGMARRGIMEDSGPPVKRRVVGGAFSRLGPAPVLTRREREDSPYEEELPHKLSVHSSVVSTSRDAKNRQEIMQEQNKDKEGMQRNRRMFGLLLGTLNKFKTESRSLQSKEEQRKKIDQKLEENAAREKRKFQQETKLLMEEMHLEQSKISRLQHKMEMVQEHSEREAEIMKLKNFVVTRAKPRIFWRPRQMTPNVENQMRESEKVVDAMLQEGQDRLEKEIKELMERETKREERIKMRLREDGLLEEEGQGNRQGGASEIVEGKNGKGVGNTMVGQEEEEEEEEEAEEAISRSKKSRRRVVIENEKQDSSESAREDGEEENTVNNDQDRVIEMTSPPLIKQVKSEKGDDEDSGGSSEEDVAEKSQPTQHREEEIGNADESEDHHDEEEDEESARKKKASDKYTERNERRVEESSSKERDERKKGSRVESEAGEKAKRKRGDKDESEDREKEKRKRGDRNRDGDGGKSRRRREDEGRSHRGNSRERERSNRDSRTGERSKRESRDDRKERDRRRSSQEREKKRSGGHSRDKRRGSVVEDEVIVKEERQDKGLEGASKEYQEREDKEKNRKDAEEEEDADMESGANVDTENL